MSPEVIIGVGDRDWVSFSAMELDPSKYANVLFLAQIVPSRVTGASIFCKGAAQRIHKQNDVG